MILADKIIAERKKNGWSQEELAEKLGVTRQSVSKWEGAQSVPDLQRILEMSKIFGVSTDYLLKDDIEDEVNTSAIVAEEAVPIRKVSMEEASGFLSIKKQHAPKIALAAFICILSPVLLMMFAVMSELKLLPMSENAAAGIGLTVMFLMIVVGVVIFVMCGMQVRAFDFLEKERIETEYGVTGMVKEKKAQYEATYIRYNIMGVIFCIMGVVPIFVSLIFTENDFIIVSMVCLLFLLEGIGVMFFINGGVNQASFEKLLQEGDYSVEKKSVGKVYWPIVTAIYLGYSFITNDWHISWVVWPVAGVLFPAVSALVNVISGKR